MRTRSVAGAALGAAALALLLPAAAAACGGFFCSTAPVDQAAERIVFEVGEGTVRAIVQISYQGEDEDFAWILPAPAPPAVETTFPQAALQALDVATGPIFTGWDCMMPMADAGAGGGEEGGERNEGGVTIFAEKQVGPFDTVSVGSDDPDALVVWLRENGYRITAAMVPYIHLYVQEGMVFLAMKLAADATADEIEPIVFSWEGDAPLIPLRLTAVAAEPEMGITVWILAKERYESTNFANLLVKGEDLAIDPNWGWGGAMDPTNYLQHVARLVDDHAGQAIVTQMSGETASLKERFANTPVRPDTEENRAANDAIVGLLGRSPYMTRLYTRLAPEEMIADPVFAAGPAVGGDVAREIDLSMHFGDGGCQFPGGGGDAEAAADACDFVACGAGGRCALDGEGNPGCACVDGAVARTVMEGRRAATTCQAERMRFPTDDEAGLAFQPACTGFDCGAGGECVDMNGTPTCRCAQGSIAIGAFETMGEGEDARQVRRTTCVAPVAQIPDDFYRETLPDQTPFDDVAAEGEGEAAEGEGEGGDGSGDRTTQDDGGLCSTGPGTGHGAPLLPALGLLALGWGAIRRR